MQLPSAKSDRFMLAPSRMRSPQLADSIVARLGEAHGEADESEDLTIMWKIMMIFLKSL
jgi:hypothetical protein